MGMKAAVGMFLVLLERKGGVSESFEPVWKPMCIGKRVRTFDPKLYS